MIFLAGPIKKKEGTGDGIQATAPAAADGQVGRLQPDASGGCHPADHAGALFGAVCGLLWDYTAGRTVGLLALGLLVLGFAASIIVRMYLQETSANFLLLVAGSALLLLSTDFLFFYAMRGYPNGLQQYCTVVLPTLIFTAALSPLAFVGARAVHARWGES